MIDLSNGPMRLAQLAVKLGSWDAAIRQFEANAYQRGINEGAQADDGPTNRMGCNTLNQHIAPALADVPCIRERVPACEGCGRAA